jgi:arylsulfatase A-like enzyme
VARPNHKNPLNFFLNGKAMGKMEGFSAQIVADQIVQWFRNHRKTNKPFFLTVWLHEPHGPVNSDPEFTAKYEKLPDPSLRQYLANITQIDEAVGTIVQSLKEAGVYDDTLIWYTSDNGPEGRHDYGTFNKSDHVYGGSRSRGRTGGLRGRKRHTHEGGIRVPGIVSWPAGLKKFGTMPGGVCGEPVIGSDVFPTFLDLAGIPLPENKTLDSASILPLLQDKPLTRSRPLYWRNTFHPFSIALRDGDWKLIGDSKRTKFELYNLRIDPRETTDLSVHEPEVFQSMKKTLIAYDREVIAEGPKWWQRQKGQKESIPVD